MGESITEGTISKWVVQEGALVQQGDLLLELETDKVNMEINAEQDGVVEQILKREGDTVKIGESVGLIRAGVNSEQTKTPPEKPAESVMPPEVRNMNTVQQDPLLNASPAARKLARERGLAASQIQSRDPIGRIYQEDIKLAGTPSSLAPAAQPRVQQSAQEPPARRVEPVVAAEMAIGHSAKPAERRRMSRRRLTIAKRLVEAQRTAAMLTTFNEVDMTAILDIRKRRKQSFLDKYEVGLGFMSFFTKAVIGALKAFPLLNAEIDGDDVVVKQYYDIGIAVSAKEGLVVPVVRDANQLSFAEIEKKIAELANKARSNSLELSELQGGTFTITNGGVFGSLLSTPILNTPQVGILGMHKIQLRPVAIDEVKMENRPMMYIALSYDHRIVDGSEAVRFLVKMKELLEDPETLLLEG
jgi:2-oxoglutarate dehydrogenase E2 component (dihydrolipoamide succinyltransferase)